MTEGKYYSKTENRYCHIYNLGQPCKCQICGKKNKNPVSLTWDDNEEQLENVFGSDCVKKLKLNKV